MSRYYASYKPYTRTRAIVAYIIGFLEFRRYDVTGFFDWKLQDVHDQGRARAHWWTRHYFDKRRQWPLRPSSFRR